MPVAALREEFAQLHTDCNALLSTVSTEKRDFKPDEKEIQDKRFARMDTIKAQIEQDRKLAEFAVLNDKVQGAGGVTAQSGTDSKAALEFAQKMGNDLAAAKEIDPVAARAAINTFMRSGAIPDSHKFTLTSGTDSSIMLPKAVVAPYLIRRNVNAFRRAIALRGYMPMETTTTTQIVLPVWDDTGNVGQTVSESSTTNTTADSTVTGSVTLNATLYESKSKWFSNTLLNAEGFDVLSYVFPILSTMLDKAQESAFTTTATTNLTTNLYTVTATQVGVKYADLLAWEHTLPVAYRSDAVFVLADTLYKALRGMVDSNARPIIDLNPAGSLYGVDGKPMTAFIETIHGFPIVVSDYLTALTNGSAAAGTEKCGIFISADAIKMRDVVPQRLTRYTNIPTFPDQTGYDLFANGDCQFVNAGGSVLLY